MQSGQRLVDVTSTIDRSQLTVFHYTVFLLCGSVALMDGYDSVAIGVTGASIATSLALDVKTFGPVFSAAQFGFMAGAFFAGPIADKAGRKGVLVSATVLFGVFSLLTILSHGLEALVTYRFVTGVGLGGAATCFVSLASEYAPKRVRGAVVAFLWTLVPAGNVVGGLLASILMPRAGWESVYLIGGELPGRKQSRALQGRKDPVAHQRNRRGKREHLCDKRREILGSRLHLSFQPQLSCDDRLHLAGVLLHMARSAYHARLDFPARATGRTYARKCSSNNFGQQHWRRDRGSHRQLDDRQGRQALRQRWRFIAWSNRSRERRASQRVIRAVCWRVILCGLLHGGSSIRAHRPGRYLISYGASVDGNWLGNCCGAPGVRGRASRCWDHYQQSRGTRRCVRSSRPLRLGRRSRDTDS